MKNKIVRPVTGFAGVLAFLMLCGAVHSRPVIPGKSAPRTLIVFFDGLRPDYITPEAMPHLYRFTRTAFACENHHSVFPTVTRVNSASYATGSYPASHGILGNSVYFPDVNPSGSLNTSYKDLQTVAKTIKGPLLTASSLGEILQAAGEKMYVFSSGTTGQAFLQNHTVNGAVINPELILPASIQEHVVGQAGPPPSSAAPKSEKHRWITDAFLKMGTASDAPLVSAVWYSDPDGAAHSFGIGSVQAREAISAVDAQFGRIMERLESLPPADRFNIIISTDHGFVTHTGKVGLTDFLVSSGFKKDKGSDDIVVADGAIYVRDKNPETIRKIVASLHRQEWVGAVFTGAAPQNRDLGRVDGTLSFDLIRWNHPERAADILVAVNWHDGKNANGYAGTDFALGVAGHGGSSPYEISIRLFAKGPSFKSAGTSRLPTSNIDIVPTVLAAYGLPVPPGMNGRVLTEILRGPAAGSPGKETKKKTVTRAVYSWGTYELYLEKSVLGNHEYVNFTKVERTLKK